MLKSSSSASPALAHPSPNQMSHPSLSLDCRLLQQVRLQQKDAEAEIIIYASTLRPMNMDIWFIISPTECQLLPSLLAIIAIVNSLQSHRLSE